MKILLTNLTLAMRTGTEIVTRDLALGLAAAGHIPIVYCPDPGPIAQEIRNAGVPTVNDLAEVGEIPDVIHGHHYVETAAAMLRFPVTPSIFVCHDRLSWHDLPPPSDQIRRYVAVDRNCLERLTVEAGVPPDKTRLIHNAVDTARFSAPEKRPEQPRRALIFSNYASRGTHMEPIIEACSLLGVNVDVAGSGVEASTDAPERLLPNYDLVFAKARCALEAMAAGAAVVLCDKSGLGSMVTMSEVALLRDWNFGMRCLQQRLTPGAIAGEVMKYNADDAQAVSSWIRKTASLDAAIAAYLQLYEEVIEEARSVPVRVTLEGMLRKGAETCNALESRLRSSGIRGTVPLPPACIRQVTVRAVERVRSMDAGSTINVLVEVENTSNEALVSHEPHPVMLAYHWIDAVSQEVVVQDGRRTALSRDVPPRNLHRQPQVVEAPQRAGQYRLQLTLVQELVCWFETVNPAAAFDLVIDVRGPAELNSPPPPGITTMDLQQAVAWTDGLAVIRNGAFSTAGFIGNTFSGMLTFVESRRFARELQNAPHVTCVVTTPEIAATVPEGVGVAVCDAPRRHFVDIHNYLAEKTTFYWKDFPTVIDPSARIHPTAQVPSFNVVVGAGTVIDANAVIGERVIIGDRCLIQTGAVIGAEGFQTDRSSGEFREMSHAGGVRLEAEARIFAGAIIARGVFREFTQIGRQARIGNHAFVSHNVLVGARAFVGHGAVVNGNVSVGERAWVGPAATIANNVSIGQDAHVGLGSTVIRDVAAGARVIGAVAVRSERMLRFAAGLEKE
jgi:UDP-3-O-[3-hydroxymyristoyl] glucosamine N-acyltransferase